MSTVAAPSFGPFLNNTFGDRYLYPINRDAFNKVGSEALYKKRFGKCFKSKNSLNIIVGLDSGLLLKFIQNQGLPKGTRAIFIELPEVLARFQAEKLLDNLGEQITCITLSDFQALLREKKYRNYFYLDQVHLWQSLAADDAHIPEYLELYWTTRDQLEQYAWAIKGNLQNKDFIARQLSNVAENRISAKCLHDAFSGETAVLLAGGPSLDDFLPWVQVHREKLVVIAVSRIARRLQEVDIVPDIICSIDPHHTSFEVSKECLKYGDKTLFLNLYHVSSFLLNNWQGRSAYLGHLFPWDSPLNDSSVFNCGPTVTNFALDSAISMGFSQIILGGVDLCFSRTGHTHAKGSCETDAGPSFNTANETQVITNGGRQAATTFAMAQAILTLDAQAADALKRGCQVITTALEAAKIPHVNCLPADEIILSTLACPPWETISTKLPEDTSEIRMAHYRSVHAELIKGKKSLLEVSELCSLALKYNDGLFGRNGMKKSFKYKQKLDNLEKQLNEDYSDFVPMIKKFGLKEFLTLSSPTSGKSWSDEEVENKGREYYTIYKRNSLQLYKGVEWSIKQLELRIAEEKKDTDLPRLIQGWKDCNEPGRAPKWQKMNPEAATICSDDDKKQLEFLNKKFLGMITNQEKSEIRLRDLKTNGDPQHAQKKASILFRRRDIEGLKVLSRGLCTLNNQEATRVGYLVAGYLAELADNFEGALKEYHEIVNQPFGGATEEALRRIVSISLSMSNHENALLGLECLSNLSPTYLPQYADLTKLLGNISQALDLYADYLEKVPDDPQVLLRIAQIYQELGMSEECQTIHDYLNQQHPKGESL